MKLTLKNYSLARTSLCLKSKLMCLTLGALFTLPGVSAESQTQRNSPNFHVFSNERSSFYTTEENDTEHYSMYAIEDKIRESLSSAAESGLSLNLVLFVQGLPDNTADVSAPAFESLAKDYLLKFNQKYGENKKILMIAVDAFIEVEKSRLTSWKFGQKFLAPLVSSLLSHADSDRLEFDFLGHSNGARAVMEMALVLEKKGLNQNLASAKFSFIAPNTASILLNNSSFHRNCFRSCHPYLKPLDVFVFSGSKFMFQDPLRYMQANFSGSIYLDVGLFSIVPASPWILSRSKVFITNEDAVVKTDLKVISRAIGDASTENEDELLAEYEILTGTEEQVGHLGILSHPHLSDKIIELRDL